MSQVLTRSRYSWLGTELNNNKKVGVNCRILSMYGYGKNKQKITEESIHLDNGFGRKSMLLILMLGILFGGAFYLYEVNDRATKGYEIREVENRVRELEKESKKMKIKEVELRSMYNLEKATEEFDLVSSNNAIYLEMPGPVAMK